MGVKRLWPCSGSVNQISSSSPSPNAHCWNLERAPNVLMVRAMDPVAQQQLKAQWQQQQQQQEQLEFQKQLQGSA